MKAATECGADLPRAKGISIHAAREGGDVNHYAKQGYTEISIHAAREGGDAWAEILLPDVPISIHAAREGGDGRGRRMPRMRQHFNPRRP